VVAVALIAAGCSSNDSPSGSTSTSTTTSSSSAKRAATSTSAQAGALDTDTCWDISSDKDDLMVADTPEKARAAADSLEKYGPTHAVRMAIEHFVTTLGAQADDPDNSALAYLLNDWVKQLCPMWPNP
jgi:guanyl-specific ribonuclease Sa